MNCKPGDLAWITRDPYLFHFVKVMHWAVGDHVLPDGCPATSKPGGWVCEKACGEFVVPMTKVGSRRARYAVIRDEFLRPIRDNPGTDETPTWAGKPQPVEA